MNFIKAFIIQIIWAKCAPKLNESLLTTESTDKSKFVASTRLSSVSHGSGSVIETAIYNKQFESSYESFSFSYQTSQIIISFVMCSKCFFRAITLSTLNPEHKT